MKLQGTPLSSKIDAHVTDGRLKYVSGKLSPLGFAYARTPLPRTLLRKFLVEQTRGKYICETKETCFVWDTDAGGSLNQ